MPFSMWQRGGHVRTEKRENVAQVITGVSNSLISLWFVLDGWQRKWLLPANCVIVDQIVIYTAALINILHLWNVRHLMFCIYLFMLIKENLSNCAVPGCFINTLNHPAPIFLAPAGGNWLHYLSAKCSLLLSFLFLLGKKKKKIIPSLNGEIKRYIKLCRYFGESQSKTCLIVTGSLCGKSNFAPRSRSTDPIKVSCLWILNGHHLRRRWSAESEATSPTKSLC